MPENFYIDTKQLKTVKVELGNLHKQFPNATASALNRTLDFANTLIAREVVKEYAIAQPKVKKTLKKYKASKSKLYAYVSSTGNSLTLASFPHKPETTIIARSLGVKHDKAQIKAKVKKTGRLAAINVEPKAFLQKANNATNIFKREGPSRYPVVVLHTLSIPQMAGKEKIMSRVQEQTGKKLEERIAHEIKWRLEKAAGRTGK